MPRYVLLHHQCPENSIRSTHWDLMFERAAVLRTFALSARPDQLQLQQVEALTDHRKEYLQYEGPLTEDRGSVSRWDQGTFTIVEETHTSFVAELTGGRLVGTIELHQETDNEPYWRLIFSPA